MQKKSVQLPTTARGGRLVAKVAAAIGICIPVLLVDPANALDLGSYRQIWTAMGPRGLDQHQHRIGFSSTAGEAENGETLTIPLMTHILTAAGIFLRGRVKDGKFMTSYLQTYSWQAPRSQWTTFGPGRGKYIEARIDVTRMQARGPWVGFWLFDPSDTYDGNPSNGTQIDIMEYIVDGAWMLNRYNVADHWGSSESKIIDAAAFGKNLRRHWHTFGLEWTSSRLTYYMDDRHVWSTTRGVSTSNEQAFMLTVEYDQGPGDVWGIISIKTSSMTLENCPTECLWTTFASMKRSRRELYAMAMLASRNIAEIAQPRDGSAILL